MSYTDLPRLVRLILFTLVTLMLTSVYSGAVEPIISAEGLAEILQYPADRIEVVDLTEETQTEPGVPNYTSHQYRTDDNTFAPILIQVARAGLILTAAENEELKKLLAEKEANPELSDYAGLFSFANGAYGGRMPLVRLDLVASLVLMTIPSLSKDFLGTLNRSDEMSSRPGAEGYYRLVSGESMGNGILSLLTNVSMTVSDGVIASGTVETPVAPQAEGSETQESESPPAPEAVQEAQSPDAVSEPEPAEVIAERPNILPFIFLGLLAILIGETILRKVRKR